LDIVGLARGTRTRVVVNDRLDVALACGAAGVHLRSDSVSAAAARSIAPPGFLVGRSVHTVDEAVASARDVDYLIAGTVWPSPSKSAGHPDLGAAGLARIVRAVDVPVVAIGGVTISRLSELVASGAAGLAAIGLFMDSDAGGAEGCRAIPLVERARAARAAFDTSG
jgi:thiamine-phosphate pyrophosphorylase